jgi:hypothetical protein
MVKARGLVITAAAVLLVAGLDSCARYRVVVPTDARVTENSVDAKRARVAGYTTKDGRYHPFVAYVAVTGDSVVLTRPAVPSVIWSGGGGSPESVIVLPRAEVRSLKLSHGVSVFRGVIAVIAGILLISAIVLPEGPGSSSSFGL